MEHEPIIYGIATMSADFRRAAEQMDPEMRRGIEAQQARFGKLYGDEQQRGDTRTTEGKPLAHSSHAYTPEELQAGKQYAESLTELTALEREICRQTGTTEADFTKTKREQADARMKAVLNCETEQAQIDRLLGI
jgi:hypothetical protein